MKQENRSVVLRELRLRRGWSLDVAANHLSRSKGLLSGIENGKVRVTDKQYEYLFEKYGGHELSKQSISGLISTGERKRKPRAEDGAIYRVLRLNSGKTLITVASTLNISISYLSMIECGCRVTSTRLHEVLLKFYNLNALSFKNPVNPLNKDN